jgi:hypothetical protein
VSHEKETEMNRTLCAVTTAALIIASMTIGPVYGDLPLTAQDLESVSLSPIHPTQDGKNVALMVVVSNFDCGAPGHLPTSFTVMVNGERVNVADDGVFPDALAGDRIYTVAGTVEGGLTHTVSTSIVHGTTVPIKVKFECSIETVDCPPDCKSIIFRTPCTTCFKINCKIKF